MHADLIMLYKILNGRICINLDNCICLSSGEHSTRGDRLKLHKFFDKLDIGKYFFCCTNSEFMECIALWHCRM